MPPFPPDLAPRRRVVLYSHDTVGLGHLRRNLAIASVLVQGDRPADVLVISGSYGAEAFGSHPGIDFLTLPGIAKQDRHYRSQSLRAPLADVVALRSAIIRSAVVEFDPDLFIVDKVARGVDFELDSTLEYLSSTGRTRCVLGMRDVLDDPDTTVAEWMAAGTDEVVRDHYDAVWWYGDRSVFDPIAEYGLNGAVAARSEFTGYLANRRPAPGSGLPEHLVDDPFALCLVGGGQDGVALARAFADAEVPTDLNRIIVTGPYMAPEDRAELQRDDVVVVEVVADPSDLMARAESVVSMGGYNTVCELLAADVRPLIVPRVEPRAEQILRARRLAEMGLVDVLHPADLTPEAVAGWIRGARHRGALPGELIDLGRTANEAIDLDGLYRIPDMVDRLIDQPRPLPIG